MELDVGPILLKFHNLYFKFEFTVSARDVIQTSLPVGVDGFSMIFNVIEAENINPPHLKRYVNR